jgi:anti-anti-sigma factor
MHLAIHPKEKEGIVILDLKGRLVLGPEDLALREFVQSLLEDGRNNLIVNLDELSAVDTEGIGSLAFCAENFHKAGGRMVLLNGVESKLSGILKIATAVETYEDEVTAVNSFFPDRAALRYDILKFVEEQTRR